MLIIVPWDPRVQISIFGRFFKITSQPLRNIARAIYKAFEKF